MVPDAEEGCHDNLRGLGLTLFQPRRWCNGAHNGAECRHRGCRPTPAPSRCEGSTPQWSSCAGDASRFASFQAERRSVRAHHTKTFPHDTRKRETGGVYKRMLRNFGDTAAITPMCNGAHNQNKGIPAGPPDELQYGEATLLLAAVSLRKTRWGLDCLKVKTSTNTVPQNADTGAADRLLRQAVEKAALRDGRPTRDREDTIPRDLLTNYNMEKRRCC